MNTNKTTYLILLLLAIFSKPVFSQSNKFGFSLEYSPNFSRLTDTRTGEKFKLSHHVLLRMTYKTEGNIKPTIGLGFFNTGELNSTDLDGALGIETLKFIDNHNYLYLPIGTKINFGKIYVLPEVGIGVDLSNTTTQVTEYVSGKTEKVTRDNTLITGEFNKLSIPLSLSVGTDFTVSNISFSGGLKGYYGLNRVVRDVPRNNHFYGIGLVLSVNF